EKVGLGFYALAGLVSGDSLLERIVDGLRVAFGLRLHVRGLLVLVADFDVAVALRVSAGLVGRAERGLGTVILPISHGLDRLGERVRHDHGRREVCTSFGRLGYLPVNLPPITQIMPVIF